MLEPSENRTGLSIETKIFPMAFLLLFFKTNVSIDGVTRIVAWGTSFYELNPGQHQVEISFRYFFGRVMGESSIEFDVIEGQTVSVKYRSPFVVFSPGHISIV